MEIFNLDPDVDVVDAIRSAHNVRLQEMERALPQCEGLPRSKWNSKCVTLHNSFGTTVTKGILREYQLGPRYWSLRRTR